MSTSPVSALRGRPWALGATAALARPAAAVALALAVVLRVASLGSVRPDPFYDAAVRSMGTSWHAFLFGALEPGGSVSIDKPPFALWLQVASTKLFGFGTPALLLPEALGGCAAVAALFWFVRALWGTWEAVVAALALAVLPLSVLTSRSDTMDSLTVALTLLAAVLVVRAARTGGWWALAGAGAAIGLAFNAKVFQALIPVPALLVLYFAASPLPRGERLARLGVAAAVGAVVGLAWLAVVTTAPPREQPWAFGSSDGSALSATLVYNGVGRLGGSPPPSVASSARWRRTGAPGPLRLVARGGALRARLAPELVPALLLGGLALALALAGGGEATRRRRAGVIALGVWLLTGLVLFSTMPRLQVRYLEGLTPAIAAALGVGAVSLLRRVRAPAPLAVLGVAALLALPFAASLAIVRSGASDSGHIGTMPAGQVTALSAFLRSHSPTTRYELASSTAVKAAALIVHDARPVLMLDSTAGRVLTTPRRLRVALRNGRVRYLLTGSKDRWARGHGRDVSLQAGLSGRNALFDLSRRPPPHRRRYRSQRIRRQHRR